MKTQFLMFELFLLVVLAIFAAPAIADGKRAHVVGGRGAVIDGVITVKPGLSDPEAIRITKEVEENAFDWQNKTPVDFLDLLKEWLRNGRRGYVVGATHIGWIRDEDIPILVNLLGSNDKCAFVSMSRPEDSVLPPHTFSEDFSTVGNEACVLLRGYTAGYYPDLGAGRDNSSANCDKTLVLEELKKKRQ